MTILKKINWGQFLLAFALGSFLTAALIRIKGVPPWLGHGPKDHQHMLDKFGRRLQLTPDQKQKIGAILAASHEKINALRAEMRPKFEEIRKKTQEDILPYLTPEQQKKFNRMNEEMERRRLSFESAMDKQAR